MPSVTRHGLFSFACAARVCVVRGRQSRYIPVCLFCSFSDLLPSLRLLADW